MWFYIRIALLIGTVLVEGLGRAGAFDALFDAELQQQAERDLAWMQAHPVGMGLLAFLAGLFIVPVAASFASLHKFFELHSPSGGSDWNWERPSMATNFMQLCDPLHMFHQASLMLLCSGITGIIAGLAMQNVMDIGGLAHLCGGLGMFLAVSLFPIAFRGCYRRSAPLGVRD